MTSKNIIIENIILKNNSHTYTVVTNKDEYKMDEDTIVKYGILKNREFDEESFNQILKDILITSFFKKVLNYLRYGLRSENEIVEYLKKNDKEKELNSSDVEEIIQRLIDLKYLDNANYAKQMIDYYKVSKGKNFIINFLNEKRINPRCYNIDELYLNEEEVEIAKMIAIKYSNQIRKYPLKKQKQLLYTKLQRDGFSSSSINEVLKEHEFIDESLNELNREFIKLTNKYNNKNLEKEIKKQNIIASLMNKGYEYKDIMEIINNIKE